MSEHFADLEPSVIVKEQQQAHEEQEEAGKK
jgi:hypothetical protein